MVYVIREMKDSDWERVNSIYNKALLNGISTFQTEEYLDYEIWDKSYIKDCRMVMLADDNVVGWCSLSKTSFREVYKGVVEVSIYMDEQFTHLGLGTKLLKHLCLESEKNGYWCLYSSIISINSASVNLHKKCGFREIGIREKIAKDRFGVWQDTTLLERRNKNL